MAKEAQEPLSEDVQEIIERMPHWIVRYGLTLLLAILLMILALSWFIKYPDIIKAEITITTSPPPIDLVSRADGTLQLFVNENSTVEKGQIIACLTSNVALKDVIALENYLNRHSSPQTTIPQSNFEHLGNLQPFYNEFATAVEELALFEANDIIENQIIRITQEVASIESLILNLRQQVALSLAESNLIKEKLNMDSILFLQQVVTKVDYNITKSQYLGHLKVIKNIETSIINNQVQLRQLESRLSELNMEKTERGNLLNLRVKASRQDLLAQIVEWKKNYLFVSPTTGKLAYLQFLENDVFVRSNTALFSVIPEQGQIYGQGQLPISRSGKVSIGQSVNIRLENYPFEQYGILRGKIESIAMLPNEDLYMVRVSLPQGLTTSYRQALPFTQQLRGETEIITDDLRLLERFFFQFKRLLKSN